MFPLKTMPTKYNLSSEINKTTYFVILILSKSCQQQHTFTLYLIISHVTTGRTDGFRRSNIRTMPNDGGGCFFFGISFVEILRTKEAQHHWDEDWVNVYWFSGDSCQTSNWPHAVQNGSRTRLIEINLVHSGAIAIDDSLFLLIHWLRIRWY